jgi:hypothetical protein
MNQLLRVFAIGVVPVVVIATNPGNQFAIVNMIHEVVVLLIIGIAALCLRKGADQSWSYSLLSLGVPIGLVVTSIGMVKVVSALMTPEATELRSSIWMTTVMAGSTTTLLVGGMVSALGYTMDGETKNLRRNLVATRWWVLPLFAFLAFTIVAILFTAMSPEEMLDASVLKIMMAVLVSFLILRRSKSVFIRITEGALYGSIIIVGLGVVWWFGATNPETQRTDLSPLIFAFKGVFLGSLIYVTAYFASYSQHQDPAFDVGRMNWHFLEINAFLFFLALAPVSISQVII